MTDFWSVACKLFPSQFREGNSRTFRGYYIDEYLAPAILRTRKDYDVYFLAYKDIPNEDAFKDRLADLRKDVAKICAASRGEYSYLNRGVPRNSGEVTVGVTPSSADKYVAIITVRKRLPVSHFNQIP